MQQKQIQYIQQLKLIGKMKCYMSIINLLQSKMQKNLLFEKALGISMIVCRNPVTKKYLVIQQTDGTWWIPGGRVDAPEGFLQAGVRQCKQEAGVDVQIKGVLRMQHNISCSFVRLKSILYAEPIDPNQKPKDFKDKQSIQGKYMSLQQILAIRKKWREQSIYVWPNYIQQNGKIYPVSMLKQVYRKD